VIISPAGQAAPVSARREASRSDLTVLVTATGSAQPITQVNISSELSGTVRQVHVDYNSAVKAGQVLAELGVEKLMAAIESMRARRDAANARVAEAAATLDERRAQFARKKTLAGRDFGSVQEIEAIKLALQAIRSNGIRSCLTVLGVVIGVAAAISMVTIGNGATAKVTADLAKLGRNLLFARPGQFGPGRACVREYLRLSLHCGIAWGKKATSCGPGPIPGGCSGR